MRNATFQLARKTGLLFIALVCSLSSLFSQGFSPETINRLQQVLQKFQDDPANPFVGGISAAIKIDGLADWEGATGFASRNIDEANNLLPGGDPFTTSTLSRIYSVTKTFTAALVLELAREGALSLDAPVSNYLPLHLINPGLDASATLKQLLVHESGYSNFLEEINLQIAVAFQPNRVWTPFEVVSFAHQTDPPGTTRRYSNTGYILLGSIVEGVTGKTIQQHFRERFFTPLQLNSMYLAGREPAGSGILASPHDNISIMNPIFQLTGQPVFPDAYTNIRRFPFTAIESISFTSGGIVSKASDLAEWGAALFGGRATSSATLEQMIQSISATPDEDGDFLGYGIWRSTKIHPTDVFIGHDGSATGYRSVMFYQPERKLTIAILTNYQGAKLYEVAKELYQAIPEFICSNNGQEEEEKEKKEKKDKILVCWKGKDHCVGFSAASVLIAKGAYLGACSGEEESATVPGKFIDSPSPKKATRFSLTAYPNPFGNQATINFQAAHSGKIELGLYDATGKLVVNLYSGSMQKGQRRQVMLGSGKLAGGLYWIRLTDMEGQSQMKLVLQR